MISKILSALRNKSGTDAPENFINEFFAFGLKNVLSCFFPGFIFGMLILSKLIQFPGLPRYDLLLIACIVMQAILYFTKLETAMELLVITLFHFLGLTMEVYKVAMGSWSYPEFAYSKIYGVPLYSGFMYASVGSFVCQAWRWFHLKLENWPGIGAAASISAAIYLNFFTHHFIYDLRWVLTFLLLIIFWKTKIVFITNDTKRRMPLVLSFLLIGFFIWIGENIATFFGAWKYASQHEGWKMVSLGKISSWFLLVVLTMVIVIQLKFMRGRVLRVHRPHPHLPSDMFTFNKNYFGLAILIFIIEVLIALFVRDNFVRPYLGDVLVVILIYCFIRSFLPLPVFALTMFVLIFSFTIELLQFINIVEKLGLEKSPLARTVIGTSFEWIDLLAYLAGVAIVLMVEKLVLKKEW